MPNDVINIDIKIKSLKLKKETKLKMKNVSLGTSKNNYIDPRIIFAFIKKYNIPEDKLFNILQEYYPFIKTQYKVNWCKDKKHLPFDFVLEDKKII